jgi:hypothetical protein
MQRKLAKFIRTSSSACFLKSLPRAIAAAAELLLLSGLLAAAAAAAALL